jgi:iron complex transport system permease protein
VVGGFRSAPPRVRLTGLTVLLVVVVVISLFWGRYPSAGFTWPGRLADDALARELVLTLRIPRVLTALALGASLAAAGTVFQQIFANPLIEPGFLGVSQGAAFGACLAIVVADATGWLVQVLAAAGAFAGLGLSYAVSRRARFGGATLRLVLAGIAVSAMFSAGVGALKVIADPLTQLQELTFWLLGGLQAITWTPVLTIAPAVMVSLAVIWRMRWRLNLLSLDDSTAHSLGVAPGRERALLLSAAVVATAAVVSVCGMVGWLGLIIPHIARRLFGADTRHVLPASVVIGGLVGVGCDDLARTLLPGEIPIGILTSFIGAGFFLVVITRPGPAGGGGGATGGAS